MSGEVVFLLEEPSMKALLEILLPKVAPNMPFVLVSHEGKTDLAKSIPRKLNAWRNPGTRFIVVHDQDSADCRKLKASLQASVPAQRRKDTVIRIACRELESWILGDLEALAAAFEMPAIVQLRSKEKFRAPDNLGNPAEEIHKLIPKYQKIGGARRVAQFIDPDRNTSYSFGVFLSAVRKFSNEGSDI